MHTLKIGSVTPKEAMPARARGAVPGLLASPHPPHPLLLSPPQARSSASAASREGRLHPRPQPPLKKVTLGKPPKTRLLPGTRHRDVYK